MTVVVYGKYYIEFNFILFLFIYYLKLVVGTHDALRRATNRRAGQVIFKRMELPEIERQARFKTLKIKYKTYGLHKTINQPGFNYLQKFERKAGPS